MIADTTTICGDLVFVDQDGRPYLKISPDCEYGPGLRLLHPQSGKPAAEFAVLRNGVVLLHFWNEDGSEAVCLAGGGERMGCLSGGGLTLSDGSGRIRVGLGCEGAGAWLQLMRESEHVAVDHNSYRWGWACTCQRLFWRAVNWLRSLPMRRAA